MDRAGYPMRLYAIQWETDADPQVRQVIWDQVGSAAEHQRAAQLRAGPVRDRYIEARLLVRRALSHVDPAWKPADWSIAHTAWGKPYLVGAGHVWKFNISHVGSWILCAIGVHPLGIDLEDPARPVRMAGVVRRYFHPVEQAIWARSADPVPYFWTCWVLKEAYFKARGTGLRFQTRHMYCVPSSHGGWEPVVGLPADLAPTVSSWLLKTGHWLGHYRVALASVPEAYGRALEVWRWKTGEFQACPEPLQWD